MALIKCYECGREISDLAPACPHCGAPGKTAQPAEQRSAFERFVADNRTLLMWIFVGVPIVVVVLIFLVASMFLFPATPFR